MPPEWAPSHGNKTGKKLKGTLGERAAKPGRWLCNGAAVRKPCRMRDPWAHDGGAACHTQQTPKRARRVQVLAVKYRVLTTAL